MNGSRKKFKAVTVCILSLVLVISAIMPMMVMGSKKTNSMDYQYYSVKRGDTLTRIAKTYGVTVSDIMSANNLSNADKILAGKVLKVPVSSSSPEATGLVSTRMSMNLKNADVRDVLSAIATNAGYTIIFAEDVDQKLTVNLEQMTALKAIDYVTRLVDISYLKDGNTIMIGSVSTLNSTFIDKTVLTKFTLNYITAAALQSQASSLGLSSLQFLTTEEDQHHIHISGYPKEMAKLKELISILDVSSNVMVGSDKVTDDFTSIDLTYIDASEFNGLLGSLGLAEGIVLSSRPYTLYVYVTGDALRDIKTIKSVVDKPLTGMNLEAGQQENPEDKPSEPANPETPTTPSTPEGTTTPSTPVVPDTPATPETKILSEQQVLQNIDLATAESILSTLGLNVTVYSNPKFTKTFWLLGTTADVQAATEAIANIDAQTPAITESFTVINLQNHTAAEIMDRINGIPGMESVSFKTTSDPAISHVLIMYATADMMQPAKDVIAKLDSDNMGNAGFTPEKGWVVIEATKTAASGTARMDLIKDLYPEYLSGLEYKIINTFDKNGEPKSVIYAKATAEEADYIKAVLAQIDKA